MLDYVKNRFALVFLIIFLFISVASITRIILMFNSFSQIDLGILALIRVYFVGFIFDFAAAVYGVVPVAVYLTLMPKKLFNNRIHKYIFWFFLFFQINLLVFIIFAEWFFWEEFGKRFNFIAVDYLVYTQEVVRNILESYPIPLLLGLILVIGSFLFYFIYKKTSVLDFAFKSSQGFIQRLKISVWVIFLSILFFNLINEQSLSNISTNQFNNELSKNGLYSLFSAFRNNTLNYDENYMTENTGTLLYHIDTMCQFDGNHSKSIMKKGEERKYNVMLIMVESLSAEYMGAYGDERGLTPNLDNLSRRSLFFNNFYATGTRTVRGMEAVVLSVPPTPGRSIVKRPDCHNRFSSGFLFREKGYENKFIYAGHGYFDNMNDFFSHNGFETIDKTDMGRDEITFSNVWGVCDEDLFSRALKESDKSYLKNRLFFNFIMTTSNHRPYTYPDGKIDIPSHTGRSGGVKYTDYAIKKFLDESASKPWFNNTLFIIVADHNGGSAGETSLPTWRYKIPFLIYGPDIIKPGVVSKLSSQVDLIPTILSVMNWSYESKFYGEDILDQNFNSRAFVGTYQKLGFLRNDNLVVLEPDKMIHEYKIAHQGLYDVKYEEIDPIEVDKLDAITYYQSASFFYRTGINRWTN